MLSLSLALLAERFEGKPRRLGPAVGILQLANSGTGLLGPAVGILQLANSGTGLLGPAVGILQLANSGTGLLGPAVGILQLANSGTGLLGHALGAPRSFLRGCQLAGTLLSFGTQLVAILGHLIERLAEANALPGDLDRLFLQAIAFGLRVLCLLAHEVICLRELGLQSDDPGVSFDLAAIGAGVRGGGKLGRLLEPLRCISTGPGQDGALLGSCLEPVDLTLDRRGRRGLFRGRRLTWSLRRG